MERYFILDKYNTWYDWDLILTKKEISPAEPKTNYVSLDGMSGSLDLTEALTGEVAYQDRTINMTFWTDQGNIRDRNFLINTITTVLHGRKIKIIEPDDPGHYYMGRVKIASISNNLAYAEIKLEATCEPWRYAITDTVRTIDATQDPINIIINYNGVKTVYPTITVTDSVVLIVNNTSAILNAGTYKVSGIKFSQGVNIVQVTGSGSVTFRYGEADL